MMKMTKKEYQKLADSAVPPSKKFRNIIFAFLIGGFICSIGQGFFELYSFLGLGEKDTGTAVSVTMIFLGAVLTGLNIYHQIARFGGAGTLVPITGFANAVVSPAMEFKKEGHIMGIGAKIFTIAGPVIVFGTIASVVYGIIVSVCYYFGWHI